MKTVKYFFYVLLVAVLAVACDEREYDIPSVAITGPVYDGPKANYTIKDLKADYTATNPVEITEDLILKAYVTANDESGNLYKQLYIKDSDEEGATGIQLSIDKSGLSSAFKVGQEVYVHLKGLYVGKYGGVAQIGKPSETGIGRMSTDELDLHVFKNGLPKLDNAAPETVTMAQAETDGYIGRLVRIENLTFNNGGRAVFAPSSAGSAMSEVIADNTGKTMEVRTSIYANFAGDTIPAGTVTLVGIMGKYNNTWQFTLRTREDVTPYIADPGQSATNPFDVTTALTQEYSETAKFWTKGFIIGTVAAGVNPTNPIDDAADVALNAADFMNTTIVIAAGPDETDITKMLVVNLPEGSAMRSALNLMDNPSNKGKEVTVYGNTKEYFGAHSINMATGANTEFVFEGGGVEPPGDGDGSKENPYNVTQAQANQGAAANTNYLWVTGYVVAIWEGRDANGTDLYPNNFAKFAAPFYTNTNIFLADSPTETNTAKMVNVQLGAAMRDVLSPMNNAAVLGEKIAVRGALEKYNTFPGIKNLQEYVYEGGGITPPLPGGGGTKENPWTIAQGIANQGQSGYVKGYIVGGVTSDNSVMSIGSNDDVVFGASGIRATSILIADSKDTKNYAQCIVVNLPTGAIRSAVNLVDNPGNLGREIVITGELSKYFGIAGLRNPTDYSLGGGSTPPPPTGIFNETLMTQASFDKFTTVNVTGDFVWKFDAQYGAVMSGYDTATSSSYANEDWFISPAIDLSAVSSATLSFDHARGPASSMSVPTSNYTVWVSTNYTGGAPSTATWTPLTIPTHGTTAWGFVSSGDIAIPAVSLSATTRIAFKYVCDNTESATWEVKNVLIK